MKLPVALLCLPTACFWLSACEKANHETPAPSASSEAAGDDASAAAAKPYPLEVCIVQDEPLGSMGKPVTVIHEGQEFKFCCKSCLPDFEEDPAKFVAKLAEAVAKPAEDPAADPTADPAPAE